MSTPIEVIESNDPVEIPWRVAIVRPDQRPAVREDDEPYVMSFPHLIVREIILFQIVVTVLSIIAIVFDAPLESIANPVETPNPAKAPWYFLGLQELLHYFPPVVAGVLMPGIVAVGLIAIPYTRLGLAKGPLWANASRLKTVLIPSFIAAVAIVFAFFACWPVVVPTVLIGVAVMLARRGRPAWLARITMPEWGMTWFVIVASLLTIIGTFFRGPGWSWVWPWGG